MREWEGVHLLSAFPVSRTRQRWDMVAWQWASRGCLSTRSIKVHLCQEPTVDLQAIPGGQGGKHPWIREGTESHKKTRHMLRWRYLRLQIACR